MRFATPASRRCRSWRRPRHRSAAAGSASGPTGFVYVVSDTRVTGERDDVPAGLTDLVEAVRAESTVPVAVGFGIGTPEQAAAVGRIADGVIVGSRLVRAVAEADGPAASGAAVSEFIRAAREAMTSAGGPVR